MLKKLEPLRDAALIAVGTVTASSLFGVFVWMILEGAQWH